MRATRTSSTGKACTSTWLSFSVVRRALPPHDRAAARVGRCARRGRRGEAQSGRLRALEGGEAGRARRGTRRGARAARAGTSSARRCRSTCSAPEFDLHGGGDDLVFPAPRERTRPSRGCRPRFRAPLDPHGHGAGGRREDGEVGRQLHHPRRRARRARAARVPHGGVADALPARRRAG